MSTPCGRSFPEAPEAYGFRADEKLETAVALQLGRQPAIGFGADVYCDCGWPAVIRCATRDRRGNPNPNLFYLTCPWLRRELARLEDSGLITELQRAVEEDAEISHNLADAQERHASMWQEADRGGPGTGGGAPGAGDSHRLAGFRIAQASADSRLKCLHAHYAFHLAAGGHAVGRLIGARLSAQWCADQRCERLPQAEGWR